MTVESNWLLICVQVSLENPWSSYILLLPFEKEWGGGKEGILGRMMEYAASPVSISEGQNKYKCKGSPVLSRLFCVLKDTVKLMYSACIK